MRREERYRYVVDHFRREMPEADTELHYGSTFQLLVAVMLSAQCTDKRVNQVTPALFARYPDARAMAQAEADEVLEYISSVSYPNAKSRHLVQMARLLMAQYDGAVPTTIDQLMQLPGVGRKTANVMVAVAFGGQAMPVDTHVFRVSHRLGLVPSTDNTPLKVETTLRRHLPEDVLSLAHHWLLLHGRYVCTARAPHCDKCEIKEACKSYPLNSKL